MGLVDLDLKGAKRKRGGVSRYSAVDARFVVIRGCCKRCGIVGWSDCMRSGLLNQHFSGCGLNRESPSD